MFIEVVELIGWSIAALVLGFVIYKNMKAGEGLSPDHKDKPDDNR